MFAEVRPVSWTLIVAFLIVYVLTSVFANFVLFELALIDDLYDTTNGLINGTLIAGLLSALVLFGVVLFYFGGLRPYEISLQGDNLVPGIVAAFTMWIVTNVLIVLGSLFVTGEVEAATRWTELGITVMLGALIGQLFGNSLVEELGIRGFLQTQLFIKQERGSLWMRITIAIIASAAVFALTHLPAIVDRGWGIIELRGLVINGVFFGALYMLSDNIFFNVGVHASLFNTAWFLAEPQFPPIYAVYVAAVIVLIIWKRPHIVHFPNRSTL